MTVSGMQMCKVSSVSVHPCAYTTYGQTEGQDFVYGV